MEVENFEGGKIKNPKWFLSSSSFLQPPTFTTTPPPFHSSSPSSTSHHPPPKTTTLLPSFLLQITINGELRTKLTQTAFYPSSLANPTRSPFVLPLLFQWPKEPNSFFHRNELKLDEIAPVSSTHQRRRATITKPDEPTKHASELQPAQLRSSSRTNSSNPSLSSPTNGATQTNPGELAAPSFDELRQQTHPVMIPNSGEEQSIKQSDMVSYFLSTFIIL